MIVDIHSHAWDYKSHFSDDFRAQASRARGDVDIDLTVTFTDYMAGVPRSENIVTIAFGGKAKLSGLWVDDDYVARYVAQHSERMLGFLSVDPTQAGWQDELRYGHERLGLVGVKLLPMYAGFTPSDPQLDPLWRYATEHHLPVLLHTGTTFIRQAPLDCTYPRHLDEVAIRFPDVRIVMAHMGHPFENECIAIVRKHPQVYADISALHYRPFQFFHSLMLAQEYGVMQKLLFGTDYPFTTVSATIDTLRSLNEWMRCGNRIKLDEKSIDDLIHRDSLALLGLPKPPVARMEKPA